MDLELDQFRDVDLVIDRASDSFVQKQFVSQGDYKGRTLTVQVTNNGNVGEVPGLTLNLNWHNEASGLTDLSAFKIINKSTSVFGIEYPEHMMTPGKVYASIQIIQDGKVTNLKEFELTVQKLAGQPVGIVEKAEFSALVAVLADSNRFRTDIDSLDTTKADKTALALTDSKVADLDSVKADKTALAQTNANMVTNLSTKVDKGGNEQVTLGMLSQEVKTAMTGGSVAVVGNNAVNTTNIVNKAVTVGKAASMLLSSPSFEFNTPPNYDSTNKTLTFIAGRARYGRTVKAVPAQVLDLSTTTWGSVFLNTDTGLFAYSDTSFTGIDESNFLYVGAVDIGTPTALKLYLPFQTTIDSAIYQPNQRYENSIVYYSGTVQVVASGINLLVTLTAPVNTLFVYHLGGNVSVTPPSKNFTIPHNYSWVVNVATRSLEVIETTSVNRGKHITLITNHSGLVKYSNLRIEQNQLDTKYTQYYRSVEKSFSFEIDQDACVIDDEIWFFNGSPNDYSSEGNIYKLNKNDLSLKSTIKHNLGHANSVDYLGNHLMVHNGNLGNKMAEVSLYKNPQNATKLIYTDPENTLIKFHDGAKLLENAVSDGACCFGESSDIMYLIGHSTAIYRVLLGKGDNDLSDKTTDKSDYDRWGVFETGRQSDEYNGTAKILERFYGTGLGQCQGLTFKNGSLYLLTGYEDLIANRILLSNGTYTIDEKIGYNWMDTNGNKKNIEPESIFWLGNKIFIGGRTATQSFLTWSE